MRGPVFGGLLGRGRTFCLLALVVLATALIGCGLSRLEVDNEQGRLDQAAPVIGGTTTVGQTFVARRDRLAAVEVLLVVYGETGASDGELIFHLRKDVTSQEDLATRTFRTSDLTHNQTLRIVFDPVPDSRGRSYYFFFEGTAGSQVTVWYNTIDAYGGGNAVFSGQAQAGDLRFKTFYDYSLGMLAGDILSGAIHHGWLIFPLAALLLLPGYLAMTLAVPAEEWPGPMQQVMLAAGLSVAILPLVLLYTSVMGLSLTPAVFKGLLGMMGVGTVWRMRRLGWGPVRKWGERGEWPWIGLFLGLLGVTLGLRMVQIRGLVVPAWVDGVHHTLMTGLIAEAGGVPGDYGAWLGIGPFIYHYGFHALGAGLVWLSGLEVPRAVLVMGQVVNALVGVGVYGLTAELLGGRRGRVGGLVALGVVGTVSLMPGYYVTWGRYTQLAGLVVLPAGVVLTGKWVEEGKQWGWVLGGVAVAGLGLVHYRVLVFYVAFVVALLVYRLGANAIYLIRNHLMWRALPGWQRWNATPDSKAWGEQYNGYRNLDYFVRVALLASISLVLMSPWLLRLWATLVPTGRGGGWFRGPASFNAVPRALLDIGYDRVLLRLAVLSLLLGFVWWKRLSVLISLWVAVVVLAANPNLLGRQETWLLSNAVLVITLFLPVSLLTGALAGSVADIILARAGGRWKPAVAAVMTGMLFLVVLAGAWNSLDIVNPVTVLATQDDITAMRWIERNTEPDAGFITNIRIWQYGTYMGADGGYWIPLLTGRRTLVPPVLYSFGSREAYLRVQEELDVLAGVSGARDQRLKDLMSRHNLKYVYLGAKGGPLDPKEFLADPAFYPVYSNGAVWIFRIR